MGNHSDIRVSFAVRLNGDAERLRETFLCAKPFPHVVIDGLFPEEALEGVLRRFPIPDADGWRRFDNPQEKKLGSLDSLESDGEIRDFLVALSAAPMLEFLEVLTGIEGLIPDPYFGGGGLHQIVPGGFLKIHADFNWHPKLRLYRRLNLLIYLNKGWREEYGGHLELWNSDLTRGEKRILPTFNRTVIFATSDSAYHGHPEPLSCPQGMTRKSVSVYYYTSAKPGPEWAGPHETIFREVPRPPR